MPNTNFQKKQKLSVQDYNNSSLPKANDGVKVMPLLNAPQSNYSNEMIHFITKDAKKRSDLLLEKAKKYIKD